MENSEYPVINCDFSELEGTCCYCSEEAARQIRQAIEGLPLHAVHMIGTGDYHYISLFWLEKLSEPFTLVLFDNHPDDQQTAFGGGLLSCGSWVGEARNLPFCQASVWIRNAEGLDRLSGINGPLYLSVDLDVLSPEYARTDWDQGDMSLSTLVSAIEGLMAEHAVLGADICGGITPGKGGTEADLAINRATTSAICGLFK